MYLSIYSLDYISPQVSEGLEIEQMLEVDMTDSNKTKGNNRPPYLHTSIYTFISYILYK